MCIYIYIMYTHLLIRCYTLKWVTDMRAFLAISLWCRSGITVGEEALAAAPIVDYFIYGRLDDEVNCGISPCPRLLVGKQTQQKLGVLRFYHGYIDIDENMDETTKVHLRSDIKIHQTNFNEALEHFGGRRKLVLLAITSWCFPRGFCVGRLSMG